MLDISNSHIKNQHWWAYLARIGLFLTLLLYVIFYIVCPQEFIASDPWIYSKRAFDISQELDFGTNHVFNHRIAVTIPVAFFYWAFGINIITTNLWPLCATLIVIISVWIALPDDKSKIIGLLLCLTSIPLSKASTSLYPDIIATAFMTLSSLILFNRHRMVHNQKTWLVTPLISISLLFIAFLAKESAYWIFPLWILFLFSDLINKDANILLRRFYIPAFITGILLGLVYFAFCYIVWDDPFARFKSIQNLTGKHLWSWDKVPLLELIKRLTISPVQFFVSQYSAPILLMAIIGFIIAPQSIKPWKYFIVSCLLFFWFGSTSFTRYEPMPLVGRMSLPILPALYILASFAISRLSIVHNRPRWIDSFFPIILTLSFTGLPFIKYVISWTEKELSELNAISIVKKEVKAHPNKEYLLICSDERSPNSLSFYFEYRYPKNLYVVYPKNLTKELIYNKEIFLFIHRQRSAFLKSAYGSRHYDNEIDLLAFAPLYKSGNIELLKSKKEDNTKILILLSNHVENNKKYNTKP